MWECPQPEGHQGDHGDAEHSWAFNRCPGCHAEVLERGEWVENSLGWMVPSGDTHTCRQEYERPEYGITGWVEYTCSVIDERLVVSSQGCSGGSGIGSVMALRSPLIERLYMGMGADSPDIPDREKL